MFKSDFRFKSLSKKVSKDGEGNYYSDSPKKNKKSPKNELESESMNFSNDDGEQVSEYSNIRWISDRN